MLTVAVFAGLEFFAQKGDQWLKNKLLTNYGHNNSEFVALLIVSMWLFTNWWGKKRDMPRNTPPLNVADFTP